MAELSLLAVLESTSSGTLGGEGAFLSGGEGARGVTIGLVDRDGGSFLANGGREEGSGSGWDFARDT